MRLRTAITLTAVAGIGLLGTGCDAFDEYTVRNNTQQDLVTWASFYPCDEPSGPGTSFNRAETVEAGTAYNYELVWGGFSDGPQCVVIATFDRRAVLLQEFRPEATYTIDEPVVPGEVLPAHGDLNEDDFLTAIMHRRVDALFLTAVVLAFLLGILVALFFTAKFFFDHNARKGA